jgi:phosphomannomutase/phosphoglucomutase
MSKRNLPRLLLLVVAAMSLALGGYAFFEQQRYTDSQQQLAAVSNDYVEQLIRDARELRNSLTRLASDETVLDTFETTDAMRLRRMAKNYSFSIPGARAIRFLLPGHTKIDTLQSPALSYAGLELLREAESGVGVTKVWLLGVAAKDPHLALAIGVKDAADTTVGVIYAAVAADQIVDINVVAAELAGYIEMQQVVDDVSPLVTSRVGSPVLATGQPVAILGITGTAWQLAYWYDTPGVFAIEWLWLLLVVVAVLAVVIALVLKRASSNKPVVERRKTMSVKEIESRVQQASVEGRGDDQSAQEPILVADEMVSTAGAAMQSEPEPEPGIDLPESIFRAYDIRGVVGDTLSTEIAYELGRSIGSEAAARDQESVIIARDGRLSGPELSAALGRGLVAAGRHVIDLGQVPTPVLYFATHHLEAPTGVMVTGSHNPPDYNGMKIVLAGETIWGDTITGLRTRLLKNDLISGEGSIRERDIVPDYLDRIVSDVILERNLKVVVDCGNGVAGGVAPELLRQLGCEVIELFCEVDGNFPNHHPDPSKLENVETLIAAVKAEGADLGVAFDGDGDRLGVIDSDGNLIWPDRQMMLYAADVLSREPGADIIYDVKCSRHLARVILDHGGRPLMWKTGHSLVKAKIKETGAPLAGEMSGHIFFKERWYGFDDALYTCARLLEIIAADPRPTVEIFAELPDSINTPELNVPMAEGENFAFIAKLMEVADFPANARVTDIDGLRVDFEDSWGLVRGSNTTPCLVLRFEADNDAAMKDVQNRFRSLMLSVDPDLDLPF